MDTARIAALLQPFLEPSLPESLLNQISTYIDLLLRWNARILAYFRNRVGQGHTRPCRRAVRPAAAIEALDPLAV